MLQHALVRTAGLAVLTIFAVMLHPAARVSAAFPAAEYLGDDHVEYNHRALLSARVTTNDVPQVGWRVDMSIGILGGGPTGLYGCSGFTDANGVATCSSQRVLYGPDHLRVFVSAYPSDAGFGAYTEGSIVITGTPTSVDYTGSLTFYTGEPIALTARLVSSEAYNMEGSQLDFQLQNDDPYACSGQLVEFGGNASCNQFFAYRPGTLQLTISYSNVYYYQPPYHLGSSTTVQLQILPPRRPTTKDSCTSGGWQQFRSFIQDGIYEYLVPAFKNQGDCVSYVNTGR